MASFLSNYKVFAKIIIISIFVDFIMRRLLFAAILPAIASYIITANYIILTITLVALVYYRVYEFLLSKTRLILKVPIVAGGVCFIILMVILLYLRTFDAFYYLLLSAFYIMLSLLYIPLLHILANSAVKSNIEYKVSISAFIFLLIVSFLVSTILDLSSIFPYIERFTFIQYYFEKVMTYTMLVLMLYFSFYGIYRAKKHALMVVISKSLVIAIILAVSIMFPEHSLANMFMQIFASLSVKIILPVSIYIFVAMCFVLTLITIMFERSSQKTYFIALSMFILSGLSSTDLYLRLLSIFSLIEMINLNIEDNAKQKLISDTTDEKQEHISDVNVLGGDILQ